MIEHSSVEKKSLLELQVSDHQDVNLLSLNVRQMEFEFCRIVFEEIFAFVEDNIRYQIDRENNAQQKY